MRRKSSRNAAKATPEKAKPEVATRRSRRHSKRRKRSTSQSSAEDSDDVSLKVIAQSSEPVAPVVVVKAKPPSDEEPTEQPVWKVTMPGSPSGELQKLKICLTRPASNTPERQERPTRRRYNKSGSHNEEELTSPEERTTRQSQQRGSASVNTEELSSSQDSQEDMKNIEVDEDKKGKGKSKGKHKTKIEKTPQISEADAKAQSEISENVQVTPQSPQTTIDIPVDNESVVHEVEKTIEKENDAIEPEGDILKQIPTDITNEETPVIENSDVTVTPVFDSASHSLENEKALEIGEGFDEMKQETANQTKEEQNFTEKNVVSDVVESEQKSINKISEINDNLQQVENQLDHEESILRRAILSIQVKSNEPIAEVISTETVHVPDTPVEEGQSSCEALQSETIVAKEKVEEAKMETEVDLKAPVEENAENVEKIEVEMTTATSVSDAEIPEIIMEEKVIAEAVENAEIPEKVEEEKATEISAEKIEGKMTTATSVGNAEIPEIIVEEKVIAEVVENAEIPEKIEEEKATETSAKNAEIPEKIEEEKATETSAKNAEIPEKIEEEKATETSTENAEIPEKIEDEKATETSVDPEEKEETPVPKVVLSPKHSDNSAVQISSETGIDNPEVQIPSVDDSETEKVQIIVPKIDEIAAEQFQVEKKVPSETENEQIAAPDKKESSETRGKSASPYYEQEVEKPTETNNEAKSQPIEIPKEDIKGRKRRKRYKSSSSEDREEKNDQDSKQPEKMNTEVEIVNQSVQEESKADDNSKLPEVTLDQTSNAEETSFILTKSYISDVNEIVKENENLKSVKNQLLHILKTPKEGEKAKRKRKWGDAHFNLDVIKPKLFKINVETIKSFCPDLEFLEEHEVKLESIYPKERRKSSSSEYKEKRYERKVSLEPKTEDVQRPVMETQTSYNSSKSDEQFEPEVDNANIIAMNRKISIVDDTASKLRPPPSPAKSPASEVLFITNLVRPFTLKQLKELLERTGKIKETGFWTDRIKSKCYVHYDTEEEALATRNALHGVHWPIGNGKKLMIDFATPEDLENARNPPAPPQPSVPTIPEGNEPEKENQVPAKSNKEEEEVVEKETKRNEASVREWDLGKEDFQRGQRKSKERDRHVDKRRHSRHSVSPPDDFLKRKQPKKETEAPQKLMDDLFNKTKATPSIYWLPLTPDEISTKQQQRLLRMAEHKRRMEESSRSRADHGRGGMYRRRYD